MLPTTRYATPIDTTKMIGASTIIVADEELGGSVGDP